MRFRTKLAAAFAAVALAAGFGLTAAGSASAAPARATVGTAAVHAQYWSCGYYSGTTETVYGNTGDRVREIQCLLLFWGFSVGSSGVDGDFGSNTLAAVKAFQTWDNGRGAA